MFVVNPWIWVESPPGATCQTLCGVPGFSFSRRTGFGLLGAVAVFAVVAASVAGTARAALEVESDCALGALSWCVTLPFWATEILIALPMFACPGPI